MKKINLHLTDLQYRELKDKAHENNISMSWLVREAVDEYLTSKKRGYDFDPWEDPFTKAIGSMDTGDTDLSVNHDKYLYDDTND
ncbi:MAG: ribbon-helix-helix domain-containing protein [Actinobacteria bacterium]|nr:ribbon-helix-helix domain-containing protein [Actinomycetota bacterium]